MPEIRRLTPDELVDSKKIVTVAFNGRHDYEKEEKSDKPEMPGEWRWGAFENGRIVSTLLEIPYVMRFDGSDAKLNGISFVGTLPEARRGGMIRLMMEALLREAYENGVVFSSLIPFNHSFYRKFGYELCCTRKEVRIPVKEFERFKPGGSYEQIFPGCDYSDLKKIHGAYISDINHAIRRDIWPDDMSWRLFTHMDPYKTGCYLYLWRDDAGTPRSYIKYQHKYAAGKNELSVLELAFTDRDAMYAQLAFTGSLSAHIEDFVWEMPAHIDATDFADVAWDVEMRITPRDMTRIINVKAALELMRRPAGEGSYVIETFDGIIPENTAKWLVEYGPEGSSVTVTDRTPDIVCDLPALAQLVTGYRTPDNMLLTSRQRVEIPGDIKTLRKVFTVRPQHITEYF